MAAGVQAGSRCILLGSFLAELQVSWHRMLHQQQPGGSSSGNKRSMNLIRATSTLLGPEVA
jgi:hypothetical protein